MGLFDKKYCDICGDKIGLLGNRKLEDGNLCKNCASKLSPWFSDRRRSTVQDIKDQLAYREENRSEVEAFQTTRTYGRNMKVLIDDNTKKFMVTRARNLSEANPDVLELSQVTGCRVDVDENKREIYNKDKDGKNVSYNPKRYEYSYDFNIVINVNHPYFDEIKFQLNDRSIENGNRSINDVRPTTVPPMSANARRAGMNAQAGVANAMLNIAAAALNASGQPAVNPEYQAMMQEAEELKAVLLQTREEIQEDLAAQNAPKMKVTCPSCGASTLPDATGCCEFCGSPLS